MQCSEALRQRHHLHGGDPRHGRRRRLHPVRADGALLQVTTTFLSPLQSRSNVLCRQAQVRPAQVRAALHEAPHDEGRLQPPKQPPPEPAPDAGPRLRQHGRSGEQDQPRASSGYDATAGWIQISRVSKT